MAQIQTIQVLDKAVAELIAAGEVVERPASVVKELLENAVDAGADIITVEIQNGGISSIRVTDNGCGIPDKDVPTAFLRHATSKLRTQWDLEAIGTLGFRGEALAAVSAVSRVELRTRTPDSLTGTQYAIEGGAEALHGETGCPAGTTILVRDLFYNTPARMKFLKRDAVEASAVGGVVERIALSNPQISFKFISNGAVKLHTPGDGNLLSAIYAIFGKAFAGSLLPVSYQTPAASVAGFVSKPMEARANRSMQYLYVNGRYVRTKTGGAALEEAYKGSIMTGKFPACVLQIDLDPGSVDVNVHPAKIEVKFSDDRAVYDAVYFAVKSSLNKYDVRPEIHLQERAAAVEKKPPPLTGHLVEQKPPMPAAVQGQKRPAAAIRDSSPPEMVVQSHPPLYTTGSPGPLPPIMPVDVPEAKTEAQPEPPILLDEAKPAGRYDNVRMVGELFRTYILLEDGEESLILLDKHAAHERLLYEKLKRDCAQDTRQVLLSPVTLNVSAEEYGVLASNGELLERLGFMAEPFGQNTILIREVPLVLDRADAAEMVLDISRQLLSSRREVTPEKWEDLLHSVACRSAVKAHNQNERVELQEIIRLLNENEDVKFCPHGRPVAILLHRREIEKQFGRLS